MKISNPYIVLSASRMTDLPAFYPHELIKEVNSRKTKGYIIQTLILWTKHPARLLQQPLFEFFAELKEHGTQLFLNLTITGMGRMAMGTDNQDQLVYPEPNVPKATESLTLLPRLIELTGKPDRIKVRIDPIIKYKDYKGNLYSNIDHFEPVIASCVKENVRNFVFSFLEKNMHKKVDARFKRKGLEIISPDSSERAAMKEYIQMLKNKYCVQIAACCVQNLPESSCIDSKLLGQLHNEHIPAPLKQPRSRPLCGCTSSVDIGGWPIKSCPSGCLYCYARPVIKED